MPSKLSVVLATKNEEENISQCLTSVKDIADEIIVFDENSEDKTGEVAEKLGAKVFKYVHKTNFHETKQKAIEKAEGDWILQLDADERVTAALAKEISEVITASDEELLIRKNETLKENKLFARHQKLIEEREGKLGKPTGEVVAFFIPRRNMFLGKPLKHTGVYPDGVIRLIRKGKARLPGKSVHELMEVDGEVGWLENDLEHHDSLTLERYLDRANRYTDLTAKDFAKKKVSANIPTLLYYSFLKPKLVFLNLFFRHKGFMDGMHGFIWSLFSALHYPIAYFKYWQTVKK